MRLDFSCYGGEAQESDLLRRLDVAVALRGLAPSRSKARELIEDGSVKVNGITAVKPSMCVADEDSIAVDDLRGKLRYVSRAGLKLEYASERFGIVYKDKVCADIGASAGGFTDYMLRSGASLVYAVDVGHGQLDERLCCDERVVNMEGVSVRKLCDGFFERRIDVLTADLSFISLETALPYMLSVMSVGTYAVFLIKPQFEVGPEHVGRGGIVRNRNAHLRALERVCGLIAGSCRIVGVCPSPIKGGDGNTEYLACAEYTGCPCGFSADLNGVVREAFS